MGNMLAATKASRAVDYHSRTTFEAVIFVPRRGARLFSGLDWARHVKKGCLLGWVRCGR